MQPVTARRFLSFFLCAAVILLMNACGGTDISSPGKPVALTQQTIPASGDYSSPPSGDVTSSAALSSLNFQGKPVKVAILLPLSGAYSEIGKAMLDAAQLALFDINVPNLSLMPIDTKGTALGATRAVKQAIDNEAKLILGPLFSNEAKAVAPIAYEKDINVISFSNDESLTGQGIFLLGHAPKEQVKRITDYALEQNIFFFAALTPNDTYGAMVARALRDEVQGKGHVTKTDFYMPTKASIGENVQRTVSSLARISKRQLKDWDSSKNKKAADGTAAPVAGEEVAGPDGKGLLIPEGGAKLEQLLRPLTLYNLRASGIRLLGTGQWEEANVENREMLEGAWFASTPSSQRQRYEGHFKEVYSYTPPRISSLAYDAVALSAALATVPGSPDFSHVALTTKRGFVGVDGIFRLDANGVTERGLAIMEITPEGTRVIDPAPTSFLDVRR
ncbi:MAG: putative lipoprotein [Rickettsiales bacterium]|nr:putative lipoprotein [Rickettsiales bacterium]